jgi:hypothetical protein
MPKAKVFKNISKRGGELKMKKIITVLAVLALVATPLFAVCEAKKDNTGAIKVEARVPNNVLDLTWGMSKCDTFISEDCSDPNAWTPDVTQMQYGTLIHNLKDGKEAGLWFSKDLYVVFLGVLSTTGRQFTVTSSSAGLSGPGGMLPKGWGIGNAGCYDTEAKKYIDCDALGTAPLYNTGAPAQGSNVIFVSANPPVDMTGKGLRVDYSIPPYKADESAPFNGHAPIPLIQKGGLYHGAVKITVTD